MSAPTMEERKACWGARDEFWQCLDSHGDDASECEKLRLGPSSRRSARVPLPSASRTKLVQTKRAFLCTLVTASTS
ncbi:PREDICTED: uncharacterized protein LOC103900984 [Aptenodytes forsteri]|uniref:uncharacterized protein LOC103900984 n=1 Tax=Aptenodytes forsteri TaxID=9233 RepID=UPI000904630A|nr:PREDICTED: uncharacterized protein LOC103900984 [Aptenodytes forsteri]